MGILGKPHRRAWSNWIGFAPLFARQRRLGHGRKSGYVMVTTAITMTVLLGFAGLAADVAYLEHVKRRMQTAADAGALAAAQELLRAGRPTVGCGAGITTAGQDDASRNGFTDGTNNVTVTVNCPPQATGSRYASDNNAVEVVVSQSKQPSFFMGALGYEKATVSTRAVGHLTGAPACVYALSPSGTAVSLSGAAVLSPRCGIVVDSSATTAITASGASSATSTVGIAVTGGYSISGGATINPTPVTGVVASPDPLGYLSPPTSAGCGSSTGSPYTGSPSKVHLSGSTAAIFNPGVYCGGIDLSGSSTATFNPVTAATGPYIIAGGGINASGTGALTGNGVVFYVTGTGGTPTITGETAYGGINLSGSGAAQFSAPSSGDYAGILFESDRTINSPPSSSLSGGANTTFNGVSYFPNAAITLSGGSSTSTPFGAIVANTVTISGNGTVTLDSSTLPGSNPIRKAILGE